VTGLPVRILLVLVLAAVAGGAALAYSSTQPKNYAAGMRFGYGRTVSPEFQMLGAGFLEPQIDENIRVNTEATEVGSYDVAIATAKAHPEFHYTPGDVQSHVTATPVRDTLTVWLAATADTPEKAARLAAAYGQAYLTLRRQRERARATAAITALQTQLATLPRDQKAGVQGGGLRGQISALNVVRSVGTGEPQVLEAAHASSVAVSPNTLQNVGFGVLFGLAVGIGMVALRSEGRSRSRAATRIS
jgi:uncharacterized protein involved in exopolysaccharide biosynthesis